MLKKIKRSRSSKMFCFFAFLLFFFLFSPRPKEKLTRGGGKSEEEDEKVASLFGSLDPYGRIFWLEIVGHFLLLLPFCLMLLLVLV